MNSYTIPVFPGDGIGPEVIAEGRKVLDAAGGAFGFRLNWREYPHGADHYLATGELLPESVLQEISQNRAIYFGACGDPRVPPGVLEKGLVIAIRMYCDQYVNLRPVRLLPGVTGTLRDKSPAQIDIMMVRENTEDFYVALGGRAHGNESNHLRLSRRNYTVNFDLRVESGAEAIAYQLGVVSRTGCQRIFRYAFDLARRRRKRVSLVDKANVLTEMYSFLRQQFAEVAAEYPDVIADYYLIDAACMWMIRNPEVFDVIVAPNMFGDILSEVGASIQGGLGLAPGANLNPEGTSMFEPIHGSAPPFKGLQKANPLATIWAGALMLDCLGEQQAAAAVMEAMGQVLFEGRVRTPDLGGTSKTAEVGDAVARRLHATRAPQGESRNQTT